MSWLILIIAGLFEVGFATCLGKARENGSNTFAWMIGFFGAKSSKEGKRKRVRRSIFFFETILSCRN